MPDSWGRVVATANFDNFLSDAIWSPCDRFVAVAKSGTVELLDATTLGRLCSFETPGNVVDQQLGFSPDSRFLTLRTGGEFISWDLQTGGRLGIFISSVEDLGTERLSFTHSEDGKMVAVAYGSRSFSNFNGIWSALIDTYDLLWETCGFSSRPGRADYTPDLDPRWISPICNHRSEVDQDMAIPIHLGTPTGRGRVFPRSRWDH